MKVVALIGGSCVGKSTLAGALRNKLGAQIYTGKDYVRLAKGEAKARRMFAELLASAVAPVVFVVSEKDQLDLLPKDCVRVLMSAPLEIVRERFAKRMDGKLPPPVAAMLEKKHGMFGGIARDLFLESGNYEVEDACARIARMIE